MKKYDKYQIGHARLGYYVACLTIDPTGEKDFLACDYLHPSGIIKTFAGEGGYFETESEAQAAIHKFTGCGYLPEKLFEI